MRIIESQLHSHIIRQWTSGSSMLFAKPKCIENVTSWQLTRFFIWNESHVLSLKVLNKKFMNSWLLFFFVQFFIHNNCQGNDNNNYYWLLEFRRIVVKLFWREIIIGHICQSVIQLNAIIIFFFFILNIHCVLCKGVICVCLLRQVVNEVFIHSANVTNNWCFKLLTLNACASKKKTTRIDSIIHHTHKSRLETNFICEKIIAWR